MRTHIVFCSIVALTVGLCCLGWDDGYVDVEKVLVEAFRMTTRSWEYGTLAEALLELRDPDLTVFSRKASLDGRLPCAFDVRAVAALQYAKPLIWTNDTDELIGGEGSPADPASLGVSALLLSCNDSTYSAAARRQANYLKTKATRFEINATHSAISHRDSPPELWGDFIYMVPPFLAFYGAVTADAAFIREAVLQCELYHEMLQITITLVNGSTCAGLWRHVVSQPSNLAPDECCSDQYVWLTSNAWAIAGMARVLATITRWQTSENVIYRQFATDAEASMVTMMSIMLECLMAQSRDTSSGLLKNYLDGDQSPSTAWAFGDAAGTALVTSAVYRLSVLVPHRFSRPHYLEWARQNYKAVARHVDHGGKVSPVASVDGVPSRYAADQTSEGQSMTILMYAAWRDCQDAGVCRSSWEERLRDYFSQTIPRLIRNWLVA